MNLDAKGTKRAEVAELAAQALVKRPRKPSVACDWVNADALFAEAER